MQQLFNLVGWAFWLCCGLPLTTLLWLLGSWKKLLEDAKKGRLVPAPTTLTAELSRTRTAFGTHLRVPVSAGVSLHAVALGAHDKPLMLFIHGFPESWYSWRHQLKHFSDRFYCVALTPRGYGESDKPEGVREYEITKLAADVRGAVQALKKDTAIVVGHDWGGVIAWHVAMFYPEIVQKLVIINSPHPQAYLENLTLSQLKKSFYFVMFQTPFLPEWQLGRKNYKAINDALMKDGPGVFNKEATTIEDAEIIKYDFSREGSPTAALNYYRNLLRAQAPEVSKARRRKLVMPVLLLWGKNDMFLEPELNVGIEKYCDNVRFVVIDQCSHWAQQDRPDVVNQAMDEFLNRDGTGDYGDDSKGE